MPHQPTFSYTSPKLEKRPVPHKGGYGLFAIQPIAAGELLAIWGGEIRSAEQIANLPPEERHYGMQVEEGFYQWSLVEGETADFFNHSCNPNAGLTGQIGLVAMREIAVNEEVCFDYAMADGSPVDEFECGCGAPNCRKHVTGDDWMRLDLQTRYAGYFSPYLQRRIRELREKLGLPALPTRPNQVKS